MNQFTRLSLFLGLAGCLAAQTLSFGEISLVTPATNPPTYLVNLVLKTAGTPNAGQVAGLQFDLNFNPASLNVTIGLGAASTAASQQLNTVCLGQAIGTCATPAANNPSTKTPPNAGPGWRAIIIGCCGGAGSPTSNLIADGVVATLTVQAKASPTDLTLHLPFSPNNYMAATSQGGNNIAATAIPLTVGAGASDPNATGILDMSKLFLVGGVYPPTSDSAPNFGSGSLQLNDLLNVLFAVNKVNVAGYPSPLCGSDRFDAMDSYPLDTDSARGGLHNGTLTLNDLLTELFMVNKLPGYTSRPMRIPHSYTCTASLKTTEMGPTGKMVLRRPAQAMATLTFGANQPAGGQDRVPVYVEARQDISRLGLSFGVGDQQSQLQFQPASGVSPSLVGDSSSGVMGAVAVAWLNGLELRGGQRLLLGYVVGPAGSAGRLSVSGMSASTVDKFQEVGLEVSGAVSVQPER